MIIQGRVRNGVVVLESDALLPEGTPVTVSYAPQAVEGTQVKQRVELPLVRSANPGSLDLTGEQIAEILDEEDSRGVNCSGT